MSTLTIKELQSHNEVMEAFPVIKQLRAHLDESSYLFLIFGATAYRCTRFYENRMDYNKVSYVFKTSLK